MYAVDRECHVDAVVWVEAAAFTEPTGTGDANLRKPAFSRDASVKVAW